MWMLFVLLALIKLPLIGLMLWMPFRNDEAAIAPADVFEAGAAPAAEEAEA